MSIESLRQGVLRCATHRPGAFASAVAVVAAVIAIGGCSSSAGDAQQASNTPANVTLTAEQSKSIHTLTVAASEFHKTVDTTGTVDFDQNRSTVMLAPISGPVARILVEQGAQVKKGQVLAEVDSPDYAAAVDAYRKAYAAARTARKLADLDRDLLAHHAVAQREADQAQSDAIGAEADSSAARQALVALNVDPQIIKDIEGSQSVPHVGGVIRAPIAGTVVEKSITPGQLLQAGTTPCFTIADLSRVWVQAQLFGSDADAVAAGDAAEILTGPDAKPLAGKVGNVSAEVDPDTRAVTARVVVANPGDLLRKQMYVRVLIHSQRTDRGLLVPVAAVLRDDENLPFVYVVQADGSFARRRVTLGYRDGDRFDITQGLRTGEKIVVDGGIFVRFIETQ